MAEHRELPLPSARMRARALWSVLRLAYRADRTRTLVALVPAWPLATAVVALAGQSILRSHGADRPARVVVAAAAAGIATLSSATIAYWQSANGLLRMAQVISTEIDDVLLAHLGTADLDVFDDPDRLDRLEILRIGRQPLVNVLAAAGGLMQTIAGTVVSALLFTAVTPWLAPLPLLAFPVAAIYFRAEHAASAAERRVAERRRVALHLYDIGTGLAEGKELRTHRQQAALLARHDQIWADIDHELTTVAMRGLLRKLTAWTAYCAVVAVALVAALRHVDHDGDLAGPSLFLLAAASGQLVFLAVGTAFLATGLRNAADIAGHLAAAVDRVDLANPTGDAHRPDGLAPERLRHGIDLTAVTYRYPGSEHDALRAIDVHLPAGSVTAIVGPNGAGKTTLVNLLLGLRYPTTGTITIDDIDLATVDSASWHGRTTAICQDFVRFELPVREGVGAGDLHHLDDADAVRSALHRAEADALVAQLPNDIDTIVGTRLGGRDLSGGQWQRLAMARSFMRTRPLLAILDEPTVSLDATTEHRLLENVVTEARRIAADHGSIVVFVSHRYATARLADQILVVDHGTITEHGTHHDLVATDGHYADLYRRQADAYRR